MARAKTEKTDFCLWVGTKKKQMQESALVKAQKTECALRRPFGGTQAKTKPCWVPKWHEFKKTQYFPNWLLFLQGQLQISSLTTSMFEAEIDL